MKKFSKVVVLAVLALALFVAGSGFSYSNDYIKWVDFNVKSELIERAYQKDVQSKGKYNFIELMAYCACKNGNKFNNAQDFKTLDKLVSQLESGKTMQELTQKNKYYKYYLDAYTAIFKSFVGYYKQEGKEPQYGLRAYYPLAAGYWNSGSDDFGNSRSYGFKRRHLGHDMFGGVGTPVVAVESGTIAEMGWNKYGGWRVGVRSDDGMRYWYYAHLRKDKPFALNLEKGAKVEAGQVVGYLGRTGYSNKENSNMSVRPHLHFGLQLIFDESQLDGNGEIWIDVYQITRFLSKNKVKTQKTENGHQQSMDLKKPIEM